MTQEFAEGSGSDWVDLDGDPRIVKGAEVLVGRHREVGGNDNWTLGMDRFVGTRQTVDCLRFERDETGCRCVLLPVKVSCYAWRRRDLICLRTAGGKLTEEGKDLELFTADPSGTWRGYAWAVRAGILQPTFVGLACRVDAKRLAMALGRPVEEPAPVKHLPEEGGVFIGGAFTNRGNGVRVYDRALSDEEVNAIYRWDAQLLPRLRAYFDASLLTGTPNPVEVLRSLARCVLTGTINMTQRHYAEEWTTMAPRAALPSLESDGGRWLWGSLLALSTFSPTPRVCAVAETELARLAGSVAPSREDMSGEDHLRGLAGWLRRPCRSGR